MSLPRDKNKRRVTLVIIVIAVFHIMESISELIEPIQALIYGHMNDILNPLVIEYYIFAGRYIFDVPLSLSFLFMGYYLT